MKELLKEIEHELSSLDGLYVTDKDLAFFNKEDRESENYWRIDERKLLKKIDEIEFSEPPYSRNNVITKIEKALIEMKRMNEIIKMNPEVSEVDKIYFDNKFGILKMEYDYYIKILEMY